jgi:hypothetical protein
MGGGVPFFLVGDGGVVDYFVFGFLPLDFEVGFRDGGWFHELHVVNVDLFGDDVGLFEASLVVVVYVAVDDPELRVCEP